MAHRKSHKKSKSHKKAAKRGGRKHFGNPKRFQVRKAKRGSGYVCVDKRTKRIVAKGATKRSKGGVSSFCKNIAPRRAKPALGARRGTSNPKKHHAKKRHHNPRKHGMSEGARITRLEGFTETLARSQLMLARKVESIASGRQLGSGR